MIRAGKGSRLPAGPMPVGEQEYRQISDFLYREADLLSDMDYPAWRGLLADDIHYLMPVRQFFATGNERQVGIGTPYFDEDADSLAVRIELLSDPTLTTAENPRSALSLLVGNVRAERLAGKPDAVGCEYQVFSRFLLSRVRPGRDGQEFQLSGRREDLLRREAGGLRLARRTVYLNQSIIKAANLSFFV